MRNRLYVLDLGRMQMARSSFFGDLAEDDPGKNDFVEFPISAYLIEGPDGRILYDAGCADTSEKCDPRCPSTGSGLDDIGSAGNDDDHINQKIRSLK